MSRSLEARQAVFLAKCQKKCGTAVDLSEFVYVNKSSVGIVKCRLHPEVRHELVASVIFSGGHCYECFPGKKNPTKKLCLSNPELAPYYLAPPRNVVVFTDVGRGSHAPVWWTCVEGHEYTCPVIDRIVKKTDWCRVCIEGYTVRLDSCEEAVQMWSARNITQPRDHTLNSGSHIWFDIDGEEVLIRIQSFVNGARATEPAEVLADVNPSACALWHEEKNNFYPEDITAKSRQSAYFKCVNGTEFQHKIKDIPNPLECKCTKCVPVHTAAAKPRKDLKCFENRTDGEEFTSADGIRYRKVGGQCKKLCSGDDNTCANLRQKDGICNGHASGIFRIRGISQYAIGAVVMTRNGLRRKSRLQFVKMCRIEECKVAATREGLCKSHSPYYNCKFENCDNIRADDNYCIRHAGGVINMRSLPVGEIAVMNALDSRGIKYIAEKNITIDGRTLRLDFHLPDFNYAIEFDGIQHFKCVDYFDGEDGFLKRDYYDCLKDNWCIDNNVALLRISYDCVDRVEDYINRFLATAPHAPPRVYATREYIEHVRDYVVL